MRIYRTVWDVLAVLVVLTSWLAGLRGPGLASMAAAVVFVGLMSALLRYTWETEIALLSRSVLVWGLVAMAAASVVFGLPPVAGPWALAVVPVLVGLSPEVVDRVVRWSRRGLPVPVADRLEDWTDAELEQRWERSAAELRHPATSVARKVALVEERARLLDEVERRAPALFQTRLARAGWHVNER